MERDLTYQRGCICWYSDPMNREEGSFILRKRRPAVIVSSDTLNETSQTVVVAPMTSATDKRLFPGQFDICLKGVMSRVRCDQLRVADKCTLEEPYATLNDECMSALEEALLTALGMTAYLPEAASDEEYESVAKLVKTY